MHILCCRDDSEAAVLPTVGFGPTVTREATVRCMAERLQSSALHRPVRGGRASELYISLRPSRWQREYTFCDAINLTSSLHQIPP